MKNYNMILTEKLQEYQPYHQAKLQSAKYEYLTCEEILPFNQKQIVEEAKFYLFSFEKAFEKQKRDNGRSGEKQIVALKT